eukprot:scaffold244898_cov30-Tisochrysis_lutea.AAC.1
MRCERGTTSRPGGNTSPTSSGKGPSGSAIAAARASAGSCAACQASRRTPHRARGANQRGRPPKLLSSAAPAACRAPPPVQAWAGWRGRGASRDIAARQLLPTCQSTFHRHHCRTASQRQGPTISPRWSHRPRAALPRRLKWRIGDTREVHGTAGME